MQNPLSLEIRPLNKKDFDYFKYLAKVEDGWDEKYVVDNIQIQTRVYPNSDTHSSDTRMLRIKAVFNNCQPELIFDCLNDKTYAKRIQEDFHSSTIHYLDDHNAIDYMSINCPFFIQNRDILYQKTISVGEGSYLIVNHSVELPSLPPIPGIVRAHTYITGYLIEPSSEGSDITYLSQSDPKGYIPKIICDQIPRCLAPGKFKRMQNSCLSYTDWKSMHEPDFKPWIKSDQRNKSLYANKQDLVNWGFTV